MQIKPYHKPLGTVHTGLRELYGYPEKLTVREAYKIAWNVARLINYQRYELGRSALWAWQEYLECCAEFGISRELACYVRLQLCERNA